MGKVSKLLLSEGCSMLGTWGGSRLLSSKLIQSSVENHMKCLRMERFGLCDADSRQHCLIISAALGVIQLGK